MDVHLGNFQIMVSEAKRNPPKPLYFTISDIVHECSNCPFAKIIPSWETGIYILKKIRNYTKTKVQNGETLPKLNIGIYSKFDQYYRYNIIMYDFIHIIQFLIPIWSWISKMMQENAIFFHFSFGMWQELHSYSNLL